MLLLLLLLPPFTRKCKKQIVKLHRAEYCFVPKHTSNNHVIVLKIGGGKSTIVTFVWWHAELEFMAICAWLYDITKKVLKQGFYLRS